MKKIEWFSMHYNNEERILKLEFSTGVVDVIERFKLWMDGRLLLPILNAEVFNVTVTTDDGNTHKNVTRYLVKCEKEDVDQLFENGKSLLRERIQESIGYNEN